MKFLIVTAALMAVAVAGPAHILPAIVDNPIHIGPAFIEDSYNPVHVGPAFVDEHDVPSTPVVVGPASSPLVQIIINVNKNAVEVGPGNVEAPAEDAPADVIADLPSPVEDYPGPGVIGVPALPVPVPDPSPVNIPEHLN